MSGERSVVHWGTTTIPYLIRRSSRRATVSLALDPIAGLIVTAPQATAVSKLDTIVLAKARWVVARMKLHDGLTPPLSSREFVSGETFLYLGRQYRLRLLLDAPARPLTLRGGWLELPIPKDAGHEPRAAFIRAALVDWYKHLAAERLPAWAQPFADKLGVPLSEVRIAEQSKRWGSCSGSTLRINWRILQAPRSLIDYVLAHEVVHLLYEHHGRDFWATLGRILPDYEDRKARLKLLGSTLMW